MSDISLGLFSGLLLLLLLPLPATAVVPDVVGLVSRSVVLTLLLPTMLLCWWWWGLFRDSISSVMSVALIRKAAA
jgi:hypothetical protein